MTGKQEYPHPEAVKAARYPIELTEKQCEEITALPLGFEADFDNGLTRDQWVTVAYAARGKAAFVKNGYLSSGDADDKAWAAELKEIAATVFEHFGPPNSL